MRSITCFGRWVVAPLSNQTSGLPEARRSERIGKSARSFSTGMPPMLALERRTVFSPVAAVATVWDASASFALTSVGEYAPAEGAAPSASSTSAAIRDQSDPAVAAGTEAAGTEGTGTAASGDSPLNSAAHASIWASLGRPPSAGLNWFKSVRVIVIVLPDFYVFQNRDRIVRKDRRRAVKRK